MAAWVLPAIMTAVNSLQSVRQSNIRGGSSGSLDDIMRVGMNAYNAYKGFAKDAGVVGNSVSSPSGIRSVNDVPFRDSQFNGFVGSDYNPYV